MLDGGVVSFIHPVFFVFVEGGKERRRGRLRRGGGGGG